jgi:hypothetical protein
MTAVSLLGQTSDPQQADFLPDGPVSAGPAALSRIGCSRVRANDVGLGVIL